MNTLLCLILVIFTAMIILSVNKYDLKDLKEGFEESSEEAQESGASEYYKWGYHPIPEHKRKKHHRREHKEYDEEIVIDKRGHCKKILRECPIWDHPDIDKYVLKSSIPPCPDVSDYARKSELCPCKDMSKYILKSEIEPCPGVPDMSEYVRKSEIPPCPRMPDMRKYVRKSEIPACPKCPICPICPRVPECPPQRGGKTVIKIQDHPDWRRVKEEFYRLNQRLKEYENNGGKGGWEKNYC